MLIIPAIDLKNGKCVRLRQGRDEETTEYSADPVGVAREWVRQGARRLHIVNLDGAFGRLSANREVLQSITSQTDILIEYGGGLRSIEDMEQALICGADKLVLGTAALEDPDLLEEAIDLYGQDRIIVALDAREGIVATRGWTVGTGQSVLDIAKRMTDHGVREILYTDISRDGMLNGPDLDTLRALAQIGPAVIASGGVASLNDLAALTALQLQAITGVIIGKALYEGKIALADAIEQIGSQYPGPLTGHGPQP